MSEMENQQYLLGEQYKDGTNLNARMQAFQRLSKNIANFYRWIFDHITPGPNSRILELGCGTGLLWQDNLDRIPPGWNITLSDFSPGMLQAAQNTLSQSQRPFTFQVIDAQAIPFEDSSFDCVIANNMLYHVPDITRALSEIRRVLKPEGVFYTSTVDDSVRADPLMQLFFPASWGTGPMKFSTANGTDVISPQFQQIEFQRVENTLEIAETDSIMMLMRSFMTRSDQTQQAIEEEKIQSVRNLVEQELAQRGTIRINMDFGIFIASGNK